MVPPLIERNYNRNARLVADQLEDSINDIEKYLVDKHKYLYNILWRNTDVTADEIVEALGTNALKVFLVAGENVDFIARCSTIAGKSFDTVLSTSDYMPLKKINPQQDGSVILTALGE
jgi:hypothetical protein